MYAAKTGVARKVCGIASVTFVPQLDSMRFSYLLSTLSVLVFLPLWGPGSYAQTELGLVAFYPFDGSLTDAQGNTANGGIESGIVEFGCGVNGQAVSLNGGNDFIRIQGGNSNNVNGEFDGEDFTLSMYFKPIGANGNQFLVSKRDTNCNNNRYFLIRYAPTTNSVSVTLRQANQEATLTHRIENTACWQHLTVVRDELRVRLYINGVEVAETGTSSRINVDNDGELIIGSANCRNSAERAFAGLIDEVRVYNRALRDSEVEQLYDAPDQIRTQTRRVFLGESVEIDLNSNCGTSFLWSPEAGVDDPSAQNPTVTPPAAGPVTYTVSISDAETGCVATDEITFQVIDPSTLECDRVYLPKAFTPNGIGPVENETFGISNPFAIAELVSFEIYDRYGAQMFVSTDAFTRWDGNFQDQPVNPGVMLWRVIYRCEGQQLVQTGSVMVLR